jgi:UDP-N-acetylbacillosamine N-acetyltransferase
MTRKQLIILGSKDFAKLVRNLALENGYDFLGFIDDYNKGKDILGTIDDLINFNKKQVQVAIGIGYNNLIARENIMMRISEWGYDMPNLVHPKAYIARDVQLGTGNIIMNNVSIDHFSVIGDGNVFWPGSIISHDCKIDRNNFFSPSATVCGFCRIGSRNFIGAGTIIVDNVKVSSGNFIKAGSVVKR